MVIYPWNMVIYPLKYGDFNQIVFCSRLQEASQSDWVHGDES